jgi:fermentation-respiration switch protein FrsA (DUF1100 family)
MKLNFVIVPISFFAGLYILLAFCIYIFQARLLYFPNLPDRQHVSVPSDIGLDYEDVFLTTSDNIRIHGWFLPSRDNKGSLLFFHGNAGNISHRLESIGIFHSLGLSILIIDYRGYGKSAGTPSEEGTYLDGEAAWEHLVYARKIPPEKIIIFGRSLGGAIAVHIGKKHAPAGVIIESSFTSVPDMAAQLYPWLPVRWLSRLHYNSRQWIKSINTPVLIVHSREDDIIPFSHGEKLFAEALEPKTFLEISGSHNDGFLTSGEKYVQGVSNFLACHLEPHI